MRKKEYLALEVFSRKLLTEGFAKSQLDFLSKYEGGIFRPERCDVVEPLHEKFDTDNLQEPVRWLSQPGGQVTFRRSHSIRVLGYIKNELFPKVWIREKPRGPRIELKPTVPEPAFCTSWVVWIDSVITRKKPGGLLKNFLIQVFLVANADYGFLTSEEDHKLKNFLVTIGDNSTSEQFVGDNPEQGIPGLYWMNLFSPFYVNWLGREKFGQVKAHEVELLSDGSAFVQFGASVAECMSDEVLGQQRQAINLLNPNAFFDISRPDRKLETPDFGQRVLTVP